MFFTLVMPCIQREWVPAAQATFHRLSHSVLLWGCQLMLQLNPGTFLFGFLPFLIIPLHTSQEASSALRVFNVLNTYIILLERILPLNFLFTTVPTRVSIVQCLPRSPHTPVPTTCWVTLSTPPIVPWEHWGAFLSEQCPLP